jgi:hypothetical protein
MAGEFATKRPDKDRHAEQKHERLRGGDSLFFCCELRHPFPFCLSNQSKPPMWLLE